MNMKLGTIQDWPELAKRANWSTTSLAQQCGVSVRTLERHFLKVKGQTPKAWLSEQRQLVAIELLKNGSTVKATANHTGYKHASAFSREFKKHWGNYPTLHRFFKSS